MKEFIKNEVLSTLLISMRSIRRIGVLVSLLSSLGTESGDGSQLG